MCTLPGSMELWGEQLCDFMDEFVQQPAVLVGNSIGSLTSLVAASAKPERVAGLALLNCAGVAWVACWVVWLLGSRVQQDVSRGLWTLM